MKTQRQQAEQLGYVNQVDVSDIIQYFITSDESLTRILENDVPEIIAHGTFNEESILCLRESELRYEPSDDADLDDMIIGTVLSAVPQSWKKLKLPEIMKYFSCYIHNELPDTYRTTTDLYSIDIYDPKTYIHIASFTLNRASRFELRINLSQPVVAEDDISYPDQIKEAVQLWSLMHDVVASEGEASSMPIRYIDGDPQHRIFVGATHTQQMHNLEPLIITAIDQFDELESSLPTPSIEALNYALIEEATEYMTTHEVTQGIWRAITVKREIYHGTGVMYPLSTQDILEGIDG